MTVLAEVLKHVPLRQRLQHCSLVCTAWAAAAAIATTSISLFRSAAQLDALKSWLQKHGRQVETLSIDDHHQYGIIRNAVKDRLQLPGTEMPQLSTLKVTGHELQLQQLRQQPAAAATHGIMAAAAAAAAP